LVINKVQLQNILLMKKNNLPYTIFIGANIRKWRELKGIKQEQLAQSLGITKAALSNIENNKTDISLHRLEDISLCLGLEVMKLFINPIELILPPPPIKHKTISTKAA